jgi:hypothetical protein
MIRAQFMTSTSSVTAVLVLSACVYAGPYTYYPGLGGYYTCTNGTPTAATRAASDATGAPGVPTSPPAPPGCAFVAVPLPAYYPAPVYYGYPAYYGYPYPAYYGRWGGGYWRGGY